MTLEHAEREAESLSRTLGCEVTAADVLAMDAEWDSVWSGVAGQAAAMLAAGAVRQTAAVPDCSGDCWVDGVPF